MPKIHVQRETVIARDFRVQAVADLFDLHLEEKSRLDFVAPVPDLSGARGDWKVGLIVGGSGTGKSSVARAWAQHLGAALVEPGSIDWPRGKAVVSCFRQGLEVKTITMALSAVGFASPPAWCLPYDALSTGQKSRCDLARALLEIGDASGGGGASGGRPLFFDELTSVVDRVVAKAVCMAVEKAVREERVPCRRFVGVTCHHDVADWLRPDWVLDLDRRELARGSLQRPAVRLLVRRLGPDEKARLWPAFARHHYLDPKLHRQARAYCAFVTFPGGPEHVAGFLATMPNAGFTGYRRVHRLVTLPDFQGMGAGLRLLDAVAAAETAEGSRRFSIRTSHPALVAALRRRRGWRCTNVERYGTRHKGLFEREQRSVGSGRRGTVGFAYLGA